MIELWACVTMVIGFAMILLPLGEYRIVGLGLLIGGVSGLITYIAENKESAKKKKD